MIDVNTRVEPGTLRTLDQLPRWDTTSVETIRASLAAVEQPPVPPHPKVLRTDEVIPGRHGQPGIRVRWYRPIDAGPSLPCLLYLHGGGYIMGTLEANDDRMDQLVVALGCAIVSVDWRLAPENPYPAGLDDAEAVWRSLTEDATGHGINPARLVVGGASAGGGLAAALCLRLRERGMAQPRLQLLIYPMLDDREITPSIRALENGPGHPGLWHIEAQRLCWSAYLGPLSGPEAPATAAPARADDLSGLAPAFIGVGDVDAFRDENVDYATRLANAGVPNELHVYPGVIHGGFLARPSTPRTQQFLRDIRQALTIAFGRGDT